MKKQITLVLVFAFMMLAVCWAEGTEMQTGTIPMVVESETDDTCTTISFYIGEKTYWMPLQGKWETSFCSNTGTIDELKLGRQLKKEDGTVSFAFWIQETNTDKISIKESFEQQTGSLATETPNGFYYLQHEKDGMLVIFDGGFVQIAIDSQDLNAACNMLINSIKTIDLSEYDDKAGWLSFDGNFRGVLTFSPKWSYIGEENGSFYVQADSIDGDNTAFIMVGNIIMDYADKFRQEGYKVSEMNGTNKNGCEYRELMVTREGENGSAFLLVIFDDGNNSYVITFPSQFFSDPELYKEITILEQGFFVESESITEDSTEDTAETTTVEHKEPQKRGDKSEEVVELQKALIELGYLNDVADGQFGGNTENAVKAAQAHYGLEQTGIADEELQNKLFSELD